MKIQSTSALSALVVCPACRMQLNFGTDAFRCTQCRAEYPVIDGIPCLVPHPKGWSSTWKAAQVRFLGSEVYAIQEMERELENPALLPSSKKRIERLCHGKQVRAGWLHELFAPVLASFQDTPSQAIVADDLSPDKYYENLLRDWVWTTGEAEEISKRVFKFAGSQKSFGTTLFLGAGGCRLPYDFYRSFKCDLLVAADWNPFLLLAANAVMRGEVKRWVEIPEYAKRLDDAVVEKTNVKFDSLDQNFQLLLADLLDSPFKPEVFDTVVSAWFLDIVNDDLAALLPKINRFLKAGGRWINIGPLTFGNRKPSQIFSCEETLELIGKNGFSISASEFSPIPYLQSPYSSRSRSETVLTFAATKTGPAAIQSPKPKSPWLADWDLAIPTLPQFQQMEALHHLQAKVLSLVDGKMSIRKMAEKLSREIQLPATALEQDLARLFSSWI